MPMARTWEGMALATRVRRAAGRAIVATGLNVAIETKRVTHVQYGNLRRSVHAAPVKYDGGDDENRAASDDLLFPLPEPTQTTLGPAVEVGSWLPYACVEWIGRGHPGITQGLENVRGSKMRGLVMTAFREEGL